MFYNGYTQQELDSLLKLLDELQVPHELHADEGLLEQTTAGDKGQRRGALNASYMRVEIDDEVLKKVNPQHYRALERYHIFPQYLDTPEGLDFSGNETSPAKALEPKQKKPNYVIQVVMLIITAMMIYGAVQSRTR